MSHTFACLQYHLVFGTRERKRFLAPDCFGRIHGYIHDQAGHHKETTFQEEFVHLLERHRIAYDKRYIWV